MKSIPHLLLISEDNIQRSEICEFSFHHLLDFNVVYFHHHTHVFIFLNKTAVKLRCFNGCCATISIETVKKLKLKISMY